jgi:hypothetical protein
LCELATPCGDSLRFAEIFQNFEKFTRTTDQKHKTDLVVGFVFLEFYLLLYSNRPPAKAENPKENKAEH